MSLVHPTPADDDADTMVDLVQDCREVSGLLGSFIPAMRLPAGPAPLVDLTLAEGMLEGYGSYGS